MFSYKSEKRSFQKEGNEIFFLYHKIKQLVSFFFPPLSFFFKQQNQTLIYSKPSHQSTSSIRDGFVSTCSSSFCGVPSSWCSHPGTCARKDTQSTSMLHHLLRCKMLHGNERKEANAVYRCRHIKWSAGKQRRHPTLLQTPTLPTASKPMATCLFISAGTPLTDDEVLFCEAVDPARLDKH